MNHKLDAEITCITVTQTALGRALGLSQQRIGQLIDEGIVVRDETARNGQVMLFESLRNYFLSRNVNLGDDANVNFWKERGLHEKAKRELAEVKLAKTRGQLYESATVEAVLSELLTNFRAKLSGLPAKYAPQLQNRTRSEIYKSLTSAIEELLTELAQNLEAATFEDEISTEDADGT